MQSALERALPIVATAYAEKFGINVIFSGDTASTNGKDIVLPLVDNLSELKQVCFGYLAHESSHIKFTEFSLIGETNSAIERSFLNLLEDIRIEKLIQEEFPGTEFTLSAMEQCLFDKGLIRSAHEQENEASMLFAYLYVRLYGEVLQRACYAEKLIQQNRQAVEQVFPAGFIIKLDVIFEKYLAKLTSTRQCLEIARRILSALEEAEAEAEAKENGDSSTARNGQADNDTQPGDSSGHESIEGEAAPDTGNDGNEESVSFANQGDDKLSTKIQNETDLPTDVMELVKDLLQQNAKSANQGRVRINACTAGKRPKLSGVKEDLSDGLLSSSIIRAKLLGLLQAKTREQRTLTERGKRVDGKRLHRLVSGNSKVFVQQSEKDKTSTSMHVLLDNSSSMRDQQLVANQAALSLSLAVSMIPQCDVAVSAFPGNSGCDVCPVIERGKPVRPNIGLFNVKSTGCTPLAEAMLYSARELSLSKRERKILIIVTDGAPDCGDSVNYMNHLMDGHIEIYAIGINSNAVRDHFKNWSVIKSVNELQSALFQIASQVLKLN